MKVLLFANTDWYLYNYRLPLALALKKRGDNVILLSPPGRYAELMQKEGFTWQPFPFERKGINPFAELLTIKRLVDVFHREKPDLIHCFTVKPVLYGSIAAHLCAVPNIINSITGLGYIFSDAGSSLQGIAKLLYRYGLKSTKVIFQNPDDLDVFVHNRLISANQAHLIPGSGVDLDVFQPSPEPSGDPVVMLAGRLLRSKGVPEFVNAARQIQAEGLCARFVVVGEPYPDNPDSIQSEELISWQKEGVIETWGWHDDMANVISKTTLVCLPTTYKEGLPRLLLEAGACGRPVVATDIPGCRMIVRTGENGLLVPPGDLQALVIALKTLIQNPDLRNKMGARGREIVEQEFSVNSVIARTLEVYKRA